MKTVGFWKLLLWTQLLLFPLKVVLAQPSLTETQDTKFQTHFFEALKQKGIGNFDKALVSLETCQKIDSKSKAVLFELSKNNLLLNQYLEAEYFAKEALQLDPKNIFLLEHLVSVYKKQQHFGKAIEAYFKILEQQPNKVAPLIHLYILNGQSNKALVLLNQLEAKNKLPSELVERKNKLETLLKPIEKTASITEVSVELFERNKDFKVLKALINNASKNEKYKEMLEISEMGLLYFPAQSKLYLSKAKALNRLSKFDGAIETIEIGLDFVIENTGLQMQFYKELIFAFKNLNNIKQVKKYQKLLVH